jgi:hypothetical protein
MSSRCFRVVVFALTVGACVLVCAARGDELKLKDGSKVTGTIVGFEENSFKVKTSYGFAVVMKDQVVSITMSDPAKAGGAPSAASAATPKPEPAKVAPSPVAAAKPAPVAVTSSGPAPATTVAPAIVSTSAPPAPIVIAKPKPAVPEPMRESVVGNTYTNDTYGFQMYKPPTWKVIEGARTILPGSITAMGTDDETTYLLIGQDAAGKSFASDVDATERRLRDILQNFRPIDDKHVTVAGLPAVERHFRGSVDEKDWSGVVVYFTKDARVYTIFGMTLADTDLVQIQENVIARAISSLQFTK